MSEHPETNLSAPSASAKALGEWVRTNRRAQGISQRALAERSGISRSYLCDIEQGRGFHPSVATLDKLAKAFGATRNDLLRASGIFEQPGKARDTREQRLLAVFRDLPPESQAMIEKLARFLHAEDQRWVQPSLLEEQPDAPDHGRTQTGPTLFDAI
jgi:transcriptional regulator with XRE-family HTH domain